MPADYEKASRGQLLFHSGGNVAANQTWYMWIGGTAGAVSDAEMPVSYLGILENLYVETEVPAGAGESWVFTVMLNGIATTITCTIAGAAAVVANDLVNRVTVAAGDVVCIRIVASLNAAACRHKAGLGLRT